jgi:hypothetical protein
MGKFKKNIAVQSRLTTYIVRQKCGVKETTYKKQGVI